MDATEWFDLPVIGKLPPEQAAEKLREIEETQDAAALAQAVWNW